MGKATLRGWLPSDGSDKLVVTIIPGRGAGRPPDANDDVVRYEFSRMGLWAVFAMHVFMLVIAIIFLVGGIAYLFSTPVRKDEIPEAAAVLGVAGLAAFFLQLSTRNLFREARNPGHQVAIARDNISMRWFNGLRFAQDIIRFDELARIAITKDLPFITFEATSVFSGCKRFRGIHLTGVELHSPGPFGARWFTQLSTGLKDRHLPEIVAEVIRRAPHVRTIRHSSSRTLSHELFD